ncbi:alpha/beta fold hydrolase [Xanthomarina sp. F2636L]|uniref:alpha/beta fold hydrolase n=1 Tax=Xanthomarina sp. F2636L TaxID=2996018 RepID=UPI00225DD0F2|nr:alpha/beta hydrolase [Xanthomarina sp. F2636L]MCX7549696.1 alpha/beta hydrolase [Xanthomarina sp. F2636L]
MTFKNIIWVLLIAILITSCKKSYFKYTEKPEYITKPSAENKPYFDAYDATLKVWDITFEELYIPTSFGTAHVVISGPESGEPLVLLHGMNASSTMWYPNIKAFTQDYRVFAIDFILEPGKSYKTKDIESVEQISAWYHEIFNTLKLKSFHLIGASRGGWLSVNLALQNQEKIKSMTLLSPAQTFIWIRPSADLLKNIIYALSSEEKQMQQNLKSMSSNVDNINKTYLEQYAIGTEKDSINKFVMSMQPFSKRDFQSLKMPVLVLIGDDDMINNEKTLSLAKEWIPNSQAETINNAGHFLSVDQAEVVNNKILKFLKRIKN